MSDIKMTEIVSRAKTMYEAMDANILKGDPRSDNIKGLTEVAGIIFHLITTIESQKEEIEKNEDRFKELLRSRISEDNAKIWKLEAEVKSLKAITELAVKGLERISVTFERGEMVRLAYEHLDKIKELQND